VRVVAVAVCQVLAVERQRDSVDIDVVALEVCRVRTKTVRPGTLFSIRTQNIAGVELEVVTAWAEHGTVVTMLAGRDGRHSWTCLSRGHTRVVLTGLVSDLDAGHQHAAACRRWPRRPPRLGSAGARDADHVVVERDRPTGPVEGNRPCPAGVPSDVGDPVRAAAVEDDVTGSDLVCVNLHPHDLLPRAPFMIRDSVDRSH
jgi:hypothetical protein